MRNEFEFSLTNPPKLPRPDWISRADPDEDEIARTERITTYLLSVGKIVIRNDFLLLSIPTNKNLLGSIKQKILTHARRYGAKEHTNKLEINLLSAPLSPLFRGEMGSLLHEYLSILPVSKGDLKPMRPEERLLSLHVLTEMSRMLSLKEQMDRASQEEDRELFLAECQKLCDSITFRDSNSQHVLLNVRVMMFADNLIPLKDFLYLCKLEPSKQLLRIVQYCDTNFRFCASVYELYLNDICYSNFPSLTRDIVIRDDFDLKNMLTNSETLRCAVHCEKTISTFVDSKRQLSFIRVRVKSPNRAELETLVRILNVYPGAAKIIHRNKDFWVEIFNHDALKLVYNMPKVVIGTATLTIEQRHRILARRLAERVFNRNQPNKKLGLKPLEIFHDIFGTMDERDIFMEVRSYISFVQNIVNMPFRIEKYLAKADQDSHGRIRIPQLIGPQISAVQKIFPNARAIACKQGVFWVNGKLGRNPKPLKDRRTQEQKDAGVPWNKEKDNPARLVNNIGYRRQYKAFRDVYLETAEDINKFVKEYNPNFFTVDKDLPEIPYEVRGRSHGKKVYPPQKVRDLSEMLRNNNYSHNYYKDETKKKPVFFAVLGVNLAETKVVQQYFKDLGCEFSHCEIAGAVGSNYGKNRGTQFNVIVRTRENLDKVIPNVEVQPVTAEPSGPEPHDYPRKPLVGFRSNTAKHLIRSVQYNKQRVPRTDRKFAQPKTFWRYKAVDMDGRLMYYYDAEGAENLFAVDSLKNLELVEYLKQQVPMPPVKNARRRGFE
jgi:hypothetical protein